MTVHCKECNAEWELPLKLPMEMRRFTKAVAGFVAAGCPECGAHGKSVLCGPAPPPDVSQRPFSRRHP